jgi:hypothetical protein
MVNVVRNSVPAFPAGSAGSFGCGASGVTSSVRHTADARPAPVVLGSWPTPLEPSLRLAAAVGLAADALWVKRDDVEFRFNV